MTCTRCLDEMWVCEDHADRPWNYGAGCGEMIACCGIPGDTCPFVGRCRAGEPCAMAGMPCPDCNEAPPGQMPMAEPGVPLTPNLICAPRGDDTGRTAP